MSTPPRQWIVPPFVAAYLFLIGAGLVVGAVGVWLNYGTDELFVTILAALGGLTMLAAGGALVTVGRPRG